MALTKILQALSILKDKVLLSARINLIGSNSTDFSKISLKNNAIYPGIGVPIFNNFFPKRKRNKGFLPKAIIMAMSFVLIIMLSATVKAANANLSALTISAGTFTPVFASGTYSYTVSENSATASVTVNPTQVIAGSVIKVNGTTVASGSNSGAIVLSAGPNTITIVVTSAGNTTETYTITVTRQNISYTGSPYSYANGYSITSQTPTVTGSPTSYSVSPALPAGLSVSGATGVLSGTPTANSAATNYTVTANYAGGITATTIINITVGNTAVLTITPVNQSQVYGSVTIPALTVTYSGFVNGDTQANMILLPSVSTTATTTSNAGTYPIIASGAQAPAYYTINYVPGTFTITGAPMTITATGPAESAGATPSGTYTTNFNFSGALNGETVTSVTLTFTPATMGATGSAYTVTPSAPTGANGFLVGNYIITYNNYSGTVQNTYTWTGGTSTTWSTNTNWSSNVTPGVNDNVIIPTTGRAPTVTGSTTINTLSFTGSNTITINGGLTLTLNKGLSVPSGVSANITMGSTTSNLSIGTASSAANINNAGTFNISGGLLHVNAGTNYIYNSGTFTANGGNQFDITGNGSSGNTAIYNTGTFKVGTSNSACILTFDDSQSILNQSGGNFFIGSTSVMRYFNTSAHDCHVTNTSGGTYTFQSDQYGSAAILAIPQGNRNTYDGTFTVERYLSAQRGYRLIASPVYAATVGSNKVYSLNYVQNSAYITGTNAGGGFDKVSQGPTLYLYREDVAVSNATFISGNYQSINNLNSGNDPTPTYTFDVTSGSYSIPISNGFLFFFRGNNADGTVAQETNTAWPATTATLSTAGTLNQGQVIFRDWYTPGSNLLGRVNGNIAAQGFNLAANPYPCTIDWETYNTTTTGTGIYTQNLSAFVYELNPTNKNYGVYQKGGGFFTNNATRYIVSGQGFFVLATTAAAQLILNETAKVSVATQNIAPNLMMGKPADLAVNYQYLRLQMAKDSINTDDIVVRFNDSTKTTFDIHEDAPYRAGLGLVSLSSFSSDNIALAINQLPLCHKSQAIALKVGATTDGIYKLNMNEIKAVPQLYDIWLMDAYKKDSLDMRRNKTYCFSINKKDTSSFGSTRFTLVLRQNSLYAYHLLDFNADKVHNAREVLVVWKTENEQNYTSFTVERSTDKGQNFDVLGSVNAAALGTYSFLDKNPVNGENIYRLKQEDYNNAITYSKIIPVEYSILSNNLVKHNVDVYPNPARNTINLAIAGDVNKPVTYSIMIINGSGSLIKKTTTSQSNWQSSVADLFPGTYMVKVFNNKDQSLVGSTKFVKL
jgi:hypothetical protein